ncbi:Fe-S oxidoreductase [Pseudomonas syringae pv. actinidiae]|uniref:Fe-S oxidoreductase n=1 Tax=Pseudomonas syringae pv. actinidiae TaxID=103796 RepID=A0A2V0Q2X0_PSESF|nr:Fe-S oxidoreductase [Pseudomonas syringae pv. actinidiae]
MQRFFGSEKRFGALHSILLLPHVGDAFSNALSRLFWPGQIRIRCLMITVGFSLCRLCLLGKPCPVPLLSARSSLGRPVRASTVALRVIQRNAQQTQHRACGRPPR